MRAKQQLRRQLGTSSVVPFVSVGIFFEEKACTSLQFVNILPMYPSIAYRNWAPLIGLPDAIPVGWVSHLQRQPPSDCKFIMAKSSPTL